MFSQSMVLTMAAIAINKARIPTIKGQGLCMGTEKFVFKPLLSTTIILLARN